MGRNRLKWETALAGIRSRGRVSSIGSNVSCPGASGTALRYVRLSYHILNPLAPPSKAASYIFLKEHESYL
jgi:hypothetical protein